MKIRIDVGGAKVRATLEETEASRDFVSLLPLTLTLEDYASTEKIAHLPRKLSTDGTPPGTDAAVGDFSYYAPWGNLALFYRPSEYAHGLVRLGKIEADVEALHRRGPLTVKIELMEGGDATES